MRSSKAQHLSVLFCLIGAWSLFAAGIGINLNLNGRGGHFVDLVKEHHNWTNQSWTTLTASEVDSAGWPTIDAMLVLDYRPVAEWAGTIDDPEVYRLDLTGTYHCSFVGQATVQSRAQGSVQNVVYNSSANTTTFDFVVQGPLGDGFGFFAISFTNTKRTQISATGTGLTNLQVIRPGYALPLTQIFTDNLITALSDAGFKAIRFMDFTITNNVEPTYPATITWNDRKRVTDASQTSIDQIGKTGGAAWEYVVALANLTGIDPWINVPLSADNAYVDSLARLLRDSLNPGLNIYVESSNEVWNSIFSQNEYNALQAADSGIGDQENHARRTIELAQIFGRVFGTGSLNNRVRVILCSHAPMLKWWVVPMLDFIQNRYGPPSDYLYAIACQTYFTVPMQTGQTVAQILDSSRENISRQIDETGQVNEAGRMQWAQRAATWNLAGGFCSYEGGPHPENLGSATNIANYITAERDSIMGELLKYNYGNAFLNAGGNLAMHFTLSSGYARYGCFGLTDDIANPYRNFKYGALKDLIAAASAVQESPLPPASSRPILFQSTPNPSMSHPSISFSLPVKSAVLLEVFNCRGSLVRVLETGEREKGTHSAFWNGRDAHGITAAPGVYVYRLTTPMGRLTKKLVLTR